MAASDINKSMRLGMPAALATHIDTTYGDIANAETVTGNKTFSGTLTASGTLNVSGTPQIGGVAVTASAAELNYLDIATLGTGAASKAVVLDASSNYTTPGAGTWAFSSGSTVNLAGTIQIGGVAVTASAAELNYTDVTTAGTMQASKALIVDANGQIDKVKNLVTAASTEANISNNGLTTFGSTEALAYTLAAPEAGLRKKLAFTTLTSSPGAVVITVANSSEVKIIENSTEAITALTFNATGDYVELEGISATRYLIVQNIGSVATS